MILCDIPVTYAGDIYSLEEDLHLLGGETWLSLKILFLKIIESS